MPRVPNIAVEIGTIVGLQLTNLWLLFELALKSEVHIPPHFILNSHNAIILGSSSVTVYFLNVYLSQA